MFVPAGVAAGVGLYNVLLIVFANFSACAVLAQLALYMGRSSLHARYVTDHAYR